MVSRTETKVEIRVMRLSRELDVARAVLYRWRDTYRTSRRARGNEPSGI